MNGTDTVKALLAAIEAGDMAKASGLMTDDLTFSGPVPQPIAKNEYVGLQGALVAAMPDWKFNATDFKEDGERKAATQCVARCLGWTLFPAES
ncbi:MAG: nuclear transport factor 2 family protein [Chloroflexi bacterium]|nr:nuclear transport factor 2 family protein [Chloroflexota bacterium]